MSAQVGDLDFFRLTPHQKRQLAYLSVATSIMLLLALTEFRSTVFSERYMPHSFCYMQKPLLIWTNVVADSLIGISYTAISVSLAYLVIKGRKDIPFRWMFLAFGLFIVACGGTHFVETVTIWIPIYVFSAGLKVFTAIASVSTAVALPFTIRNVHHLIRDARAAHQYRQELEVALRKLQNSQAALRDNNRRLENQVAARTMELTEANGALRKELEERKSLQASLTRLAAIVENSDDAIISKDLNGKITAWNHGAERLYGYKPEQVLGKDISLIAPKEQSHEIEEIIARISTGQKVDHFETKRFSSNGSLVDVSISASPVLDAEGKLCGVSTIARDITPAKRAEEALMRSEAQYRLLFEKNPMPMWIFNQKTLRFEAVNEAAIKHYGYSRREFLQMTIADIRPPEDVPKLMNEVSDAARGLQEAALWRHRKRDGTIIDVEITACGLDTPTPDSELVLAHDITDRVKSERRLRQSEERFSKVFRSSPLGITISRESDGLYLDANGAFLQMMGYEYDDLVGKTTQQLNIWHVPHDRERMLHQLEQPETAKLLEVPFRTRAGKVRQVQIAAEPVELEDQRCILAVTQDVTEARLLEQQFRQAQKMEAVGRLAGGVAHDFNNMLGVIIGYSELTRERLPEEDEKTRKCVAEIRRAAERAASLTRQLLSFSRRQPQMQRVLNLNSIVNNLQGMLSRMIGEDVSLVFRPREPIGSVQVDLGQMEQMLMNLAVNARDAMPNGGELIIETENIYLDETYIGQQGAAKPGHYVQLAVSDTGIGMDAATQAQIFDPFFTTKEPGKGTGLGLSTVWGAVKQSGGYISVYSDLGHGTTFKIFLPRVDKPAEGLLPGHIEAIAPSGNETLLVVEDEDALRELTTSVLERRGYRVLSATTGKAALDIAKEFASEIALIITDVIMPKMIGPDLVNELRKQRPDLKVLYMSGYARNLIVEEGPVKPQAAMLSKPFSSLELLNRVREILKS